MESRTAICCAAEGLLLKQQVSLPVVRRDYQLRNNSVFPKERSSGTIAASPLPRKAPHFTRTVSVNLPHTVPDPVRVSFSGPLIPSRVEEHEIIAERNCKFPGAAATVGDELHLRKSIESMEVASSSCRSSAAIAAVISAAGGAQQAPDQLRGGTTSNRKEKLQPDLHIGNKSSRHYGSDSKRRPTASIAWDNLNTSDQESSPQHELAAIPFRWEEAPGKPKKTCTTMQQQAELQHVMPAVERSRMLARREGYERMNLLAKNRSSDIREDVGDLGTVTSEDHDCCTNSGRSLRQLQHAGRSDSRSCSFRSSHRFYGRMAAPSSAEAGADRGNSFGSRSSIGDSSRHIISEVMEVEAHIDLVAPAAAKFLVESLCPCISDNEEEDRGGCGISCCSSFESGEQQSSAKPASIIPFKWEETPGKPKLQLGTSASFRSHMQSTKTSLQLPPRLLAGPQRSLSTIFYRQLELVEDRAVEQQQQQRTDNKYASMSGPLLGYYQNSRSFAVADQLQHRQRPQTPTSETKTSRKSSKSPVATRKRLQLSSSLASRTQAPKHLQTSRTRRVRGNPGSSILGSSESAGSEGVWLDADDGQTPAAAARVHADPWSPRSILQGPNDSSSLWKTPTVSDPSCVSSDRDHAATTTIPQHVDLLSTTQTAASTSCCNVAAASFCNRLLDSGQSLSCASYESFEHSLTDDAAASPATVASCTSLPSAAATWDHDLHHVRTCSSPPFAGSPYLGPNTAMAGYGGSCSSRGGKECSSSTRGGGAQQGSSDHHQLGVRGIMKLMCQSTGLHWPLSKLQRPKNMNPSSEIWAPTLATSFQRSNWNLDQPAAAQQEAECSSIGDHDESLVVLQQLHQNLPQGNLVLGKQLQVLDMVELQDGSSSPPPIESSSSSPETPATRLPYTMPSVVEQDLHSCGHRDYCDSPDTHSTSAASCLGVKLSPVKFITYGLETTTTTASWVYRGGGTNAVHNFSSPVPSWCPTQDIDSADGYRSPAYRAALELLSPSADLLSKKKRNKKTKKMTNKKKKNNVANLQMVKRQVTSRHLRRKTSLIVSNLSPFFWQLNFCKWEQRRCALHSDLRILKWWKPEQNAWSKAQQKLGLNAIDLNQYSLGLNSIRLPIFTRFQWYEITNFC